MLRFAETAVAQKDIDKLKCILPDVKTLVLKFEEHDVNQDYFSCDLRCDLDSKELALDWLKTFEQLTFTTYRADKCYAENSSKTVFKKRYHCAHNTRPKHTTINPHPSHTNCAATLMINVKQKTMKRSADLHLKEYPCHIHIKYEHNHSIMAADALRHRQPTQDVEERIKTLFSKGHSPSSAYELYKIELQDKFGEDYVKKAADGSVCPTRKWCYDLFYKIFKKEYGNPTGQEMIDSLQNMINSYNSQCGGKCAVLDQDSQDLTVVIYSPLMQRINSFLKSSQEVIFLDSSGNMDRYNSRVFLLLCASPVGGLPIGIIMTYSETEVAITKGLKLLQELVGECPLNPQVIITDDSTAERNSLASCFPSSALLLCKFHVLQNVMRFLWASKHGVKANDKVYIYKMFHEILNCKLEEDFVEKYELCLSDEITIQYPRVLHYFNNLKSRAKEWASCYRQNLLTRGNDTNNYCEAAFRVLKDKILHRTKAFSIVQMFDYLSNHFMKYYERRITSIINNRVEGKTKSKYFMSSCKMSEVEVNRLSEKLFEVTSKENVYTVDMDSEMCSCYMGKCGAPCKHQFAVVQKFKISTLQFLPQNDIPTKQLFYKILTGKEPESEEWFSNLRKTQANDNSLNINVEFISSGSNPSEINESVPNEVGSTHYDISGALSNLENFTEILKEKLSQHPETYCEAINKFADAGISMKTDANLISALSTFGKYLGAGVPLIKKGKNLQGGSTIPVQPTALSRRKTSTGRRCVTTGGRPPKSSRVEHSYPKRKHKSMALEEPAVKKGPAPHSLSYIVDK